MQRRVIRAEQGRATEQVGAMDVDKRRAVIFVVLVLALAIGVWWGFMSHWRQEPAPFQDAPKLVRAVQAYARDRTANGLPVLPRITLQDLVDTGYLKPSEVKAFDGMEVTISLSKDEIQSKQVLMRVRLKDGTVTALMMDGTVQTVPQ